MSDASPPETTSNVETESTPTSAVSDAAGSPTKEGDKKESWGKDGSVNDYSRFENVDDPDKEDPLAESLRSKDRGNDAFKLKNFAEAATHYGEAISDLPPKRDDKSNPATLNLRVTLYSNRAACKLKLEEFDKCISDATSALKSNRKAVKALFRRAQAYEKLGRMEDACRDLYAVVRIEPTNKPALKAYKRTKKTVHSRSLQAIVDAYNAAEAKEAKEAREKEEKKQREAAKKARKTSSVSSTNGSSSSPATRKPAALSEVDTAEAQADEEATLKEVKKKGYCYFNTKMDAKTQALYKNTTPQKIGGGNSTGSSPAVIPPKPLTHKVSGASTGSGSGSFSEWNKNGTTWEEHDVSKDAIKELKDFLVGTTATAGDPRSPTVMAVPKCDGTASIACVRRKMRFFFDLSMEAKYSVKLADDTNVTGVLKYPSMSAIDMDDPDEHFEVQVVHDAGTPNDKKKEVRDLLVGLQAAVEERMKEFASVFLSKH